MSEVLRYKNGLRLAVSRVKGYDSATVGVFVGAGSIYETAENNGISHFIEHMMFKGTETRSAFRIAEEMDAIGAAINAFTSKEYTCYYTKSMARDLDACVEMLGDLLYRSVFDEGEAEREKKVVLEEIAMSEDTPEDVCTDLLSTAMYGDTALGKPILGTAATVGSFTRETILSYLRTRYVASNTVVVVVGDLSLDDADKLVRKHFDTETESAPAPAATIVPARRRIVLTREKKTEQASIAIGFPCCTCDDPEADATNVLSISLGGGMSSRLFQEVREKRGLAYSVYAYTQLYVSEGGFGIYLGTNPKSARRAVETVANVIGDALSAGFSDREIGIGIAQQRSGFILGTESTYNIMRRVGKRLILTGKSYDYAADLAAIDAVTPAACNDLAHRVLDFDKACLSVVSPDPDADMLDLLR